MTDIVERLRGRSWLHAPCPDSELDREAADIIEAQRAGLEELMGKYSAQSEGFDADDEALFTRLTLLTDKTT